jgi:hypothetical protein
MFAAGAFTTNPDWDFLFTPHLYAYTIGANRTVSINGPFGDCMEPSMIFDSRNNIHVFWRSGENDTIHYKEFDSNGRILIPEKILPVNGQILSRAIDSKDRIHLCLSPGNCYVKLDNKGDVIVKYNYTAIRGLDFRGWIRPVMRIDQQDNVHIMWRDAGIAYSSPDEIFYMKLDNNGHKLIDPVLLVQVDDDGPEDMLVGPDGIVHVAWSDVRTWQIHYTKLATQDNNLAYLINPVQVAKGYVIRLFKIDDEPYLAFHLFEEQSIDGSFYGHLDLSGHIGTLYPYEVWKDLLSEDMRYGYLILFPVMSSEGVLDIFLDIYDYVANSSTSSTGRTRILTLNANPQFSQGLEVDEGSIKFDRAGDINIIISLDDGYDGYQILHIKYDIYGNRLTDLFRVAP